MLALILIGIIFVTWFILFGPSISEIMGSLLGAAIGGPLQPVAGILGSGASAIGAPITAATDLIS